MHRGVGSRHGASHFIPGSRDRARRILCGRIAASRDDTNQGTQDSDNYIKLNYVQSKEVLAVQMPTEAPVWLRLAGIANRLKTSTVPAAVAELSANNAALDEVVISALYEWAEDPQRKVYRQPFVLVLLLSNIQAQMGTPEVVALLLAAAQRSPHCVQLLRTLFRLLLKLSRNRAVFLNLT